VKADIAKKSPRILLVELWGLGDLVLMSSCLDALKRSFPAACVSVLAKPHAKTLFAGDPRIDNIIVFDAPWTVFTGKYRLWRWDWRAIFACRSALKENRFDYVLDARGDPRNDLFLSAIGGRRFGFWRWWGRGRVTSQRGHRVREWQALLTSMGCSDAACASPRLMLGDDERVRAQAILRDVCVIDGSRKIVGIHPGAGIKMRAWPIERFEAVASALAARGDVDIIVFAEPGGYGSDFKHVPSNRICCRPLRETISLMRECSVLLCNDSGPMHMAAAVDTSVVAIFGPMTPALFGPYGENHTVVMKEDVPCRPCFDRCRRESPECLSDVSIEDVWCALVASLGRNERL